MSIVTKFNEKKLDKRLLKVGVQLIERLHVVSEDEHEKHLIIRVNGQFNAWNTLNDKIRAYAEFDKVLTEASAPRFEKNTEKYFLLKPWNYLLRCVNKKFIHLDFSNMTNEEIPNNIIRKSYIIRSVKLNKNLKVIGNRSLSVLSNVKTFFIPAGVKLGKGSLSLMAGTSDAGWNYLIDKDKKNNKGFTFYSTDAEGKVIASGNIKEFKASIRKNSEENYNVFIPQENTKNDSFTRFYEDGKYADY